MDCGNLFHLFCDVWSLNNSDHNLIYLRETCLFILTVYGVHSASLFHLVVTICSILELYI